ncbi:MAG: hypothetical protein WC855_01760 [Thermodesulfovibrionales bacterium]
MDQKGISDSRGKIAGNLSYIDSGRGFTPLLFLHMKRILIEILFILMLSLFVSLIYTAVSPSGMNLLKKAFRITSADLSADVKASNEGKSKAGLG